MSQPVTVRLPEIYWEELRQIARRERRSVSEVGARLIHEGLHQARFPYIEFRSFNGERHACIKGGPQVWQILMVARDSDMDIQRVAQQLDLTAEQVQAAVHYYEAYPEAIDQALAENDAGFDRLKEMLPGLRMEQVPADVTNGGHR